MNLHDVIHTLESLAENDKAYFYGKDIGAHLRKVVDIVRFQILSKFSKLNLSINLIV
jgi:hypothetical protein